MSERDRRAGQRVAIVLTGGNVDMPMLAEVLGGRHPVRLRRTGRPREVQRPEAASRRREMVSSTTAASRITPVVMYCVAAADPISERPLPIVEMTSAPSSAETHAATTAEQARAADHGGGDGVEQDRAAAGAEVDRVEARGEDDAADGRHAARDREDRDPDELHVDAGAVRGLGAAADRVDVPAERRAPGDERPEREQRDHQHAGERHAASVIADRDDAQDDDRDQRDAQGGERDARAS